MSSALFAHDAVAYAVLQMTYPSIDTAREHSPSTWLSFLDTRVRGPVLVNCAIPGVMQVENNYDINNGRSTQMSKMRPCWTAVFVAREH